MPFTQKQEDIFMDAYTASALASPDPDGDPWSDNWGEEDLSPEASDLIKQECLEVLEALPHIINGNQEDLEYYAHTFWEERNGTIIPSMKEEFRAKVLSMGEVTITLDHSSELLNYEVEGSEVRARNQIKSLM